VLSVIALFVAVACDQPFVTDPARSDVPGAITISVSSASPTLAVGDTTHLTALVKDASGQVVPGAAVTWTSSMPTVAAVANDGALSAVGPGSTTITATSAGQSAAAPITVLGAGSAPPPTTGLKVKLLVNRFDGGTGSVLVSNAIPLPQGQLRAEALNTVRLFVRGVEQALHVEALEGRYKDGTMRSVMVQFNYPVESGAITEGELVIGSQRATSDIAKPAAARDLPLAAALPSDPNYLVATGLVGPTISADSIEMIGSSGRRYNDDFAKWADYHWTATADTWDPGYYYDRALVYYAAWARTGKAEYWYRGNRMAVAYRKGYLEPANYGASGHWSFVEGLSLHYWLTGAEASRRAVAGLALNFWNQLGAGGMPMAAWDLEGRIAGRGLQAYLFAHLLGITVADFGKTDTPMPATMEELLTRTLPKILAMQTADGAVRPASYCRESANFSTGILNDVLIQYHDNFSPDPRIVTWMRKSIDFFKTQWDPQAKAFRYISGPCPATGADPNSLAGDLNGLLINTFAWTYQQTRTPEYRDLADQVFEGVATNGYPAGDKQFNQEFADSYRYFGFRR
jgi:hypothetical protein